MYQVIPTQKFQDDVNFYIGKKRYRHIDDDIDGIINILESGDLIGDPITDVEAAHRTYKVRVANTDLHMGKSNGYRLIYYAVTEDLKIYLLTVYSKKDDDRVLSKTEIRSIIEEFCL